MNQNLAWLKKFLARPVFAKLWLWVDSLPLNSYCNVLMFLLASLIGASSMFSLNVLSSTVLFAELIMILVNPRSSLNMWLANRTFEYVLLANVLWIVLKTESVSIFTIILYAVGIFIFARRAFIWNSIFLKNNPKGPQAPLREHIDTSLV
ncbi:MAG: hypothetical protein HYT27_00620 [Parcubacteria group bacterium]|nr:hypothetical protein [Parcubacteria group bacterium]